MNNRTRTLQSKRIGVKKFARALRAALAATLAATLALPGAAIAQTFPDKAVAANEPIARLPKVPAARQTKGFEDYLSSIWIGVQVNAKTPEAQLSAIHKAAYASLANAEIRKAIENSGTVIAEPMSLTQLDNFYKKEAATGASMAKSINLQAQ